MKDIHEHQEKVHTNPLFTIFNLKKKGELEKYCRDIEITSRDLTELILGGRAGVIGEYKYACRFFEHVPDDLELSQEELGSLSKTQVGEQLTGTAAKFFRKVMQTFEVRRLFAAHLFYTSSHKYWYLFYFDQRDTAKEDNHWKLGAHIHLLTDHFNLPLDEVWGKVSAGQMNFPKLHIRYKQLDYGKDIDPTDGFGSEPSFKDSL